MGTCSKDTAIRIASIPEWASVSPTSGVLASGASVDVPVILEEFTEALKGLGYPHD